MHECGSISQIILLSIFLCFGLHREAEHLHPNVSRHVLPTDLDKFPKILARRVFLNNQELLKFVIIFFIPMTFMFDSGVILLGEIRCLSLLGV